MNKKNKDEENALSLSSRNEYFEVSDLLIENGADKEDFRYSKKVLLFMSIDKSKYGFIQYIDKESINTVKNENGDTLLIYAS